VGPAECVCVCVCVRGNNSDSDSGPLTTTIDYSEGMWRFTEAVEIFVRPVATDSEPTEHFHCFGEVPLYLVIITCPSTATRVPVLIIVPTQICRRSIFRVAPRRISIT
jgi:hypothetical protein